VDPSLYAIANPERMSAHVRGTLDVMRGDRKFMLGHEEIPVAARMDTIRAVAALVADTGGWFYR
jgi:hypothetical protein